MSNPRIPRKLKVIAGTDRPCRRKPELELPPIPGLPEPPQFLDVVGADEFTRVARVLHVAGILSTVDVAILVTYSATWSRLVRQWRNEVDPDAASLNAFRALCGELGLTPASRARLSPPSDDSSKRNRFRNNGKKRA
jgi:phage terminase small subunit